MKKTYTAPTVVSNGKVVDETRFVNPPGPEGIRRALGAGRVGYDL